MGLYLSVKPLPPMEALPSLCELLEKSFPGTENLLYLRALSGSPDHPALPRVALARLGALSLLPPLLDAAGIASASLLLRRDGQGRPFCVVRGHNADFDFNLTHTGSAVACALLTGGGRVGMDLEDAVPPQRAASLIDRFCTKGEHALLDRLTETQAADAFTRLWTVREALAKQDGRGMPLKYDATRFPPHVTVVSHRFDTGCWLSLCAPSSVDLHSVILFTGALPLNPA